MGRNIPGGNFLGGNFPGGAGGDFRVGSLMGRDFPGGNLPVGNSPRTKDLIYVAFKFFAAYVVIFLPAVSKFLFRGI